MKRNGLNVSGLAASALVAVGLLAARADTTSYDVIVEKNPFRLKPPPPPPPPEDLAAKAPPPAPPATVELTGITSILSSKRAVFEIIPGPGKQMIKPILGEGERIESVEVVSINIEKNEVTIKNGTLVTNLTFKVAKSTPAAAAPPAGGVPPPAVPAATAPVQTSYNNLGGRGVMVGGGSSPPPANTGVPNYGGNPAPVNSSVGNAAAGVTGTEGGFRSIPSRNIRSAPQAEAAINRDETFRRLEEQRLMNEAVNQAAGRPIFPPLPPTPYTPPDAPGAPLPSGSLGNPNGFVPRQPILPPGPGNY